MSNATTARKISVLYPLYKTVLQSGDLAAYRLSHLKSPKIAFPRIPTKSGSHLANQVNTGWNREAWHTHEVALQHEPAPTVDLIPRHIHRWKIQNSHEIVKKIGTLIRNGKTGGSFKATMMNREEKRWQEVIPAKEERLFQIGRITNYFS